MTLVERIGGWATRYFVVAVLAVSILAYGKPDTFAFVLPHIPWLLGVIMFGMGATLRVEDFRRVLARPREVAIGVAAQFGIMPLVGLGLAWGLRLPPELAAGVILVGCCPGGTASNVIAYMARGDVALSVTLTSVSTLLAPLLTPVLMLLLAGHWLEVSAWGLFLSIVQIVLLPVVLGLVVRRWFRVAVERCLPVLPLVSVVTIALIVGAVLGRSVDRIAEAGYAVLAAVVLHNLFGLGLAWLAGGWLRLGAAQRRAVTVEVGMQNSGLAVALSMVHLTPLAALPGALFSVWHNLTGPLLASIWARREGGRKPGGGNQRPEGGAEKAQTSDVC